MTSCRLKGLFKANSWDVQMQSDGRLRSREEEAYLCYFGSILVVGTSMWIAGSYLC